jgi:hypothetical protein
MLACIWLHRWKGEGFRAVTYRESRGDGVKFNSIHNHMLCYSTVQYSTLSLCTTFFSTAYSNSERTLLAVRYWCGRSSETFNLTAAQLSCLSL